MDRNDFFSRLELLTDIFLKDKLDMEELAKACSDYKQLLIECSEYDITKSSNKDCIHTKYGNAIGPHWAIQCIDDIIRTKMFVKGTYKVVNDLLKKQGNVELMYAGTGPFAALVLPLMSKFSPSDLKIRCLEINPLSCSQLRDFLRITNLEEFVLSIEECDATKHVVPNPDKIDVLLCETMQPALLREFQAPICINLLSQLKEDVIMIPEDIHLSAGLMNADRFEHGNMIGRGGKPYTKSVSSVFHFDKFAIKAVSEQWKENPEKVDFPASEFIIRREDFEEYPFLEVFTKIKVCDDVVIESNQCDITMPVCIEDMRELESFDECQLSFHLSPFSKLRVKFNQDLVEEYA
ncbi:hypothetical protein [Aureibacter tunicatorum]|uniref:PRMT5 arginine-N-methyltransferase domain-containing protein n=1 Tax=Aureibacter tunicatorum TaxID=866807 RepID=A0AAE4BSK4_9BACT|nr:hypothetical protein [Aureibacter tunicatorum]MDR6238945.1 hypothetical protein [Aureibacter tunicatorum]BDD05129.1 hypothetical protein AUTU_26120 [Aureibacter tunicatorum]